MDLTQLKEAWRSRIAEETWRGVFLSYLLTCVLREDRKAWLPDPWPVQDLLGLAPQPLIFASFDLCKSKVSLFDFWLNQLSP